MHERSLWPLIRRWQTDSPLAHSQSFAGMVAVTDPEEVWKVLANRDGDYERDSGFYMTRRTGTFPEDWISGTTRQLRGVLSAIPIADCARILVSATRRAHRIETQGGGSLLMLESMGDYITGGEPLLASAARQYVQTVVVPFSIRGNIPSFRRRRFRAAAADAALFFAADHPVPLQASSVCDLVLQRRQGLSAEDAAEFFLRLVLAFVGFSGVAFEYLLLRLASCDDATLRSLTDGHRAAWFVMEEQRVRPTAWRLIRVARRPHKIGDAPISPGQSVLIPTAQLHVDRTWGDAHEFDPDRWADHPDGTYLPFGRGSSYCPGASFISTLLAAAVVELARSDRIRARKSRGAPRALSLLAPPRTVVTVEPRQDG